MIYDLSAIAVMLTFTMFLTRQAMLGFPSAMFWAIFGAYCYTLSVYDWDIYYFLFFAGFIGMTIFCIFAAFGLRAKDDRRTDKDEYYDENKETDKFVGDDDPEGKDYLEGDGEESYFDEKPSEQTRKLRERAANRRTGKGRRKRVVL